ncbi:GNAT family N-acetyltransferase [Cellulomonas endophytica]|uniref:GNAT family N-acetyltransferase n=1 Tax=Cellulomonas endophytica TaxID=2494735 RepID=UPI0010137C02|nr:GNAT family N-acetyltransferase [Cellulomonas endophytica]
MPATDAPDLHVTDLPPLVVPRPGDDAPVEVRLETVPAADPDDPAASWALHGTARVSREVDLAIHGHDDVALDAAAARSGLDDTVYRRLVRLVAVRGDRTGAEAVVGRAMVRMPLLADTHVAVVHVAVLPGWRRRGIGGRLHDACLALAAAHGRTVLQSDASYALEPPPGPGALESPTGSGRIPADDDATRFALAHEWALEQVVRGSTLTLPVPPATLAELHDEARRAAGEDYRVHVWEDAVPERWLDDVALLETRMSTDAPAGGLDVGEDPWDAERVRVWFREIHGRGNGFLLAAAEHRPGGRLVAFTLVGLPRGRPAVVLQDDTLVLREHRGDRLGMLLKARVLTELATRRPSARRVHTWNAQENGPMLAINVALGFAPSAVDAEWQRTL